MKLFGISLVTVAATLAIVALLNRVAMGRQVLGTGGVAPAG